MTAKKIPSQVVNGHLPVIEEIIGNVAEMFGDHLLNNVKFLSDGQRADLFVIADDYYFFSEIEWISPSHRIGWLHR